MRRPVKPPGPTPTAIASSSASPGRSSPAPRAARAAARGRARGGPAGRRARLVLEGRAVAAQHAGRAGGRGGVEAEHVHSIGDRRRRSPPPCSRRTRGRGPPELALGRRVRPLHERDPLGGEVVVEQGGVLAGQRAEAVQVEVGHLQAAGVDLADGEGGARDRPVHPERAAGAAHEGGLAAAELARHEHDVARAQARGQLGPGRLGLLRARARPRIGQRSSAEEVELRRRPGGAPDLRPARGAGAPGGWGAGSASSAGSPAKSSCSSAVRAGCAAPRPDGRAGRCAPSARPARATCGPAAHARDAAVGAGEQLGGEVAERADHLGLDQLHLLEEVGLAGLDLVRLRGRGCRAGGSSGHW